MSMLPKLCAILALVLALVSVIIKAVAISLPNFVDVHVIADIDDANDENRIATVGIYQSVFDTTGAEQSRIAGELGVPAIKVESPSTEFPLLFPAQEHFFPALTPVNAEVIAAIDAVTGGQGTVTLGEELGNLEAVEFESCQQYSGEVVTASNALFQALTFDTMPAIIPVVASLVNQGIGEQLSDLNGGITQFVQAFISGAIENNLVNPNFAAVCTGITVDSLLDAATLTCVNTISGGIGTLGEPALDLASAFLVNAGFFDPAKPGCAETDALATCLGTISDEFITDDTGFGEAIGPNNEATEFCAADIFDCNTKGEYLADVFTMVNFTASPIDPEGDLSDEQQAIVDLRDGLGGYLLTISTGAAAGVVVVEPTTTFAEGFPGFVGITVGLSLDGLGAASDFGAACNIFNVALQFQGQDPSCSTLLSYFLVGNSTLAAQTDNAAAQALAGFYSAFAECLGEAPGVLAVCPIGFTTQIASGLFGESVEEDPTNLAAAIEAECDDDVVDNEKVGEAQIYVAVSMGFEIAAVLAFLAAVFVPSSIFRFVEPAASVLAVVAGVFVFVALTTVASAPVFEGVGEEPNGELEVVFIAGVVGSLALANGIISIVAGVFGVGATVLTCVAGDEEEDVKPIVAEEANEKNMDNML